LEKSALLLQKKCVNRLSRFLSGSVQEKAFRLWKAFSFLLLTTIELTYIYYFEGGFAAKKNGTHGPLSVYLEIAFEK
ncbi:hypothetical protein QO200_09405, partial [Flavobacterium sp. Arc3]|uniref:hypothetical protein n=1 Tax=unclassified Flavobacterium TaxID=196869 RepID=UPI00352E93BD